MGKRGSRNRNTNMKKKPAPGTETLRSELGIPTKSSKFGLKPSNSDEYLTSLRKITSGLIQTFRSRLQKPMEVYSIDISGLPEKKSCEIDQILICLVNELTEDILLQVQESPRGFSEFLLEAYHCVESACRLFNSLTGSQSVSNISKLTFYCKILKPAWDVDKACSKNSELKAIYKDLQALSKDFKDQNLLPLENLVQMINGSASTKLFSRIYTDFSTDDSNSPNRSIDSEIEEFRTRLESCEVLSTRIKPQVSQEWINTLKRQLNKIRV